MSSRNTLLEAVVKSDVLKIWRSKYNVTITDEGTDIIMISFEPLPPDTYESVYNEIVEGDHMSILEKELNEKNPPASVSFGQCTLLGGEVMMLYVYGVAS